MNSIATINKLPENEVSTAHAAQSVGASLNGKSHPTKKRFNNSFLPDNRTRYVGFYLIMAGLVVFFFLLDIMYGTVSIPLKEVIHSLTGDTVQKESWDFIIQEFRLPKALTAIIAGAGLALSGLLMQTLFKNPLAGPFVLGISNGASLGVAILVMAGGVLVQPLLNMGEWGLVLAAISGSALVLLLVLVVSVKVKDSISLLIVGMMVGSATGAVVSVLQYFSDAELIQAYLIWTFGSLAGVSWEQLQILGFTTLLGLLLAFFVQKQLNTFLLGEQYARGLGISIKRYRIIVIVATCLLAGSITAFCGPVAFVGLAVPHIARATLQTSNHQVLIPSVILIGAVLMLGCDMIAQLPGRQDTLPINAVTAMLGSPVVIWVVIRSRTMKSSI
ncbi:iron ABC transporter permease [Chondrinema litorale]|uniref:iron ABC transporter permease n=1 Tax=Chondrinema litorale TaxID=2994555 RepID=UPI0025430103|nr:iron ABC transporter permease [Chondrinema litorale]UZR99781.1 iron ABC transporter permease [Chondrinema litorale]